MNPLSVEAASVSASASKSTSTSATSNEKLTSCSSKPKKKKKLKLRTRIIIEAVEESEEEQQEQQQVEDTYIRTTTSAATTTNNNNSSSSDTEETATTTATKTVKTNSSNNNSKKFLLLDHTEDVPLDDDDNNKNFLSFEEQHPVSFLLADPIVSCVLRPKTYLFNVPSWITKDPDGFRKICRTIATPLAFAFHANSVASCVISDTRKAAIVFLVGQSGSFILTLIHAFNIEYDIFLVTLSALKFYFQFFCWWGMFYGMNLAAVPTQFGFPVSTVIATVLLPSLLINFAGMECASYRIKTVVVREIISGLSMISFWLIIYFSKFTLSLEAYHRWNVIYDVGFGFELSPKSMLLTFVSTVIGFISNRLWKCYKNAYVKDDKRLGTTLVSSDMRWVAIQRSKTEKGKFDFQLGISEVEEEEQ